MNENNIKYNKITQEEYQTINLSLRDKVKRLGYFWLFYIFIIELSILVLSEIIIETSLIINVTYFVKAKMPYIVYLSTLSTEPNTVFFVFAVVLASAPIHGIFTITSIILSNLAGYKYFNNNKFKIVSIACIGLLMFWGLFFTCMGCSHQPDWRDLLLISNRVIMSLLGQGFVIASFTCLGVFVLAALVKLNLVR